MANADTVTEQLKIAGFEQIALQRCDLPMKLGDDLDHAVEFTMSLGPAGEVLRLWEDRVDEIRPKIAAEIREALAEFEGPDGVFAPASTWIIGARVRRLNLAASMLGRWPRSQRVGARAPRGDPRADEAARGLPLTRPRSKPTSSGSRPRCRSRASGTTRRRAAGTSAAHARAQRKLKTFRELAVRRRRPRRARRAGRRGRGDGRGARLRSSTRSSGGWPSSRRSACSAATTTPATRSSPSTPAPAAPTPRTGPRCCCACTCAGPSAAASRSR